MTYDGGRGWVRDLGGNEIQVPEGEGGGVSNPLTEDLDAGEFGLVNVAFLYAATGEEGHAIAIGGTHLGINARPGGVGVTGKDVRISGGDGDDGNEAGASLHVKGGEPGGGPGAIAMTGSALTFNGNPVGGGLSNPLTEDLDAGGFAIPGVAEVNGAAGRAIFSDGALLAIRGDDGDEGLPGTDVLIRAGSGDDENDAGASITVGGGSGAGNPGTISIVGDLDAGAFAVRNLQGISALPGFVDGNYIDLDPDGGPLTIQGGPGAADGAGFPVVISGGSGDAGNNPGASITVGEGDGGDTAGGVYVSAGDGGTTRVVVEPSVVRLLSSTIGFFGAAATTQPVIPLTTPDVQDVIDALVALGLVSQGD